LSKQEINATIELIAAGPATFDRPLLSNPEMTARIAWQRLTRSGLAEHFRCYQSDARGDFLTPLIRCLIAPLKHLGFEAEGAVSLVLLGYALG
jgi:hypothetical protein